MSERYSLKYLVELFNDEISFFFPDNEMVAII